MPPLQSYKRRRVACQHFPDNQTLRLQTGAGENGIIHLPSGLDRVDCERQEEEDTAATLLASLRVDSEACCLPLYESQGKRGSYVIPKYSQCNGSKDES